MSDQVLGTYRGRIPDDWHEERLEISVGPGPPLVWIFQVREIPGGYQLIMREPGGEEDAPDDRRASRSGGTSGVSPGG